MSTRFYRRKTFPKNTDETNKDQIRKLKQQLENLMKENRKLKAENKQLNKAFNATIDKIKNLNEYKSIETIIKDLDSE